MLVARKSTVDLRVKTVFIRLIFGKKNDRLRKCYFFSWKKSLRNLNKYLPRPNIVHKIILGNTD